MGALTLETCVSSASHAKAASDGNARPAKKSSPKPKGRSSTVKNTTSKQSSNALRCSRDLNSLAAIHRIKGVKEETVSAWLVEAAPQMEQIEEVLLRDYKMSRAQLDALWTYVGHKGEKKDFRSKTTAAHSGAGRRLTPTRDSGSGAQSPKPKKKSRKS